MQNNVPMLLPPGPLVPSGVDTPSHQAALPPSGAPPAARITEYSEEPQQGSVFDYWRILQRRKYVLLAFALAGVAAGCLLSVSQSPMYRARTTLEVQDVNRESVNIRATGPSDDPQPGDAATDLQTEVQILQSETLIDRTLSKLNIRSASALNPATVKFSLLPKNTSTSREDLIHAAAKNLKVAVSGSTRMLDISFQSTDPKMSSAFANTLADEFIEQNMEARWQVNRQTSAWLTQQLDDLRHNLRKSDDALQAYARQQGLVYTADKENFSAVKLRQLQTELSAAEADRVSKESRFRTASTASPDTLADVLNDNGLRQMQQSVNDLRRQEAELAVTFKPDYTKLQRLRAEIASLQTARDQQRAQVVSRITNDFDEAENREKLLADQYDSQVRLVMADSQKSIQYDILKRDVDTNRQIYEVMLQRVKESGITSALRASNIRVIDPARTPERPFEPSLPLYGGGGGAFAFILGLVAVVLGHRSDRRLHQPGDAGRLLGLRELGVIPKAKRLRRTPQPAMSILPKDHQELPSATAQSLAWQNIPAAIADSFRAVLASIVFSKAKNGPSILAITSAGPMEGKTTTATNLAVALSRAGNRVLLIDGDTRKPAVHEAFGMDNSAGVTDLLQQDPIDPVIADKLVHKSCFANLDVLTSGPAFAGSADLLFSTAMPVVIAHFKKQYDMILIDTPPLLHMPDARVLARMSDAVVLVARAGRTLREAAVAAFDCLAQDRSNVLGVILNDWNPKSSPDGLYGNYLPAILKRYNGTL